MGPLEFLRQQHPELIALRRDLHAHPELGFEEHRTARVVAGELDKLGVEYHTGVGRTGVVGVVRGERQESGRAIGLTRPQIYRHVVFPQAIRRILPPLAGQFASIIKDSSLLSVLGISEFTLAAGEVNSFTFGVFESYVIVTAGYLVLTLPILLWTQSMEKRSRFET